MGIDEELSERLSALAEECADWRHLQVPAFDSHPKGESLRAESEIKVILLCKEISELARKIEDGPREIKKR